MDLGVFRQSPFVRSAGREWRRLRARVAPPAATLIYHLDYELPDNPLFDPRRAQRILDYLMHEGCITDRHLATPDAATPAQLALVHPYRYLETLTDPQHITRVFGEDVVRVDPEIVVRAQRRMVGGTLLAARLALGQERRGRPVVNLGGGLHHALAAEGGGFCLLNDVAVAIRQLRAEGYGGRVLIVDLDLHQGNGNRRIFANDDSVFTFSVHATDWDEGPARADLNVALGSGIGDSAYLEALDRHMPEAFALAEPDLVFYLGGVDIAADDALGSWRVSERAIFARDRRLLELVAGRPLVWVLAGGYGADAWRHTARSLGWLLAGHEAPIPSRSERGIRHFRRIFKMFTTDELSGPAEDDVILRPEDLLADLQGPTRHGKLLGYYTRYGLEIAFERYGILRRIRAAGIPTVRVEFDLEHPTGQRLAVLDSARPEIPLIDLVLRDDRSRPPYRLLAIEWLLMQNPRARPSADRPLLPGQAHPGLGCLREMVLLLVMMCERLGFDGLLFAPAHFHVAAQAHGLLCFIDPQDEARFAAIEEALQGLPLDQATHIVHGGGLVDEPSGEPVQWRAAPMALPVSPGLKGYFCGNDYERSVARLARGMRIWRAGHAPRPAALGP